jgi:UDP-glucose 4-epimerase
VVLISSGAVYGNHNIQPLRESSIPNPRSPYAVSKLASEYYVRTIGALWKIETVCLRVFNAYGPGQHIPPAHPPVIPYFLRQASQNGTLVLHGNGNQTRDYVYVEDVVNAMVSAAITPNLNQLVINVGSGKETSIKDLARLVIETTNGKPEIVLNPRLESEVSRMCADLVLAEKVLGYQPLIPLERGLQLTFEQDPKIKQK